MPRLVNSQFRSYVNDMTKKTWPDGWPPFTPSRRRFIFRTAIVAAFGAASTAAFIHGNGASWVLRADAQASDTASAADPGFDAFLKLSHFLTGKTALDGELAKAIHTALLETTPDTQSHIEQLNGFIQQNNTPAKQLQSVLDDAKSPLASTPKQIMKAWYLGIVGEGTKARAVAYEQALMYPPIADVIVMPTYARGVPGYWAAPPRFDTHAAPLTTPSSQS